MANYIPNVRSTGLIYRIKTAGVQHGRLPTPHSLGRFQIYACLVLLDCFDPPEVLDNNTWVR